MIIKQQQGDGLYVYKCDVCGWYRRVKYPNLIANCRCKNPNAVLEIAAKPRQNVTPPGLARQAYNYAGASAKHAIAGKPEATDEQVAERFAICASNRCGFFIDKGEGLGQCAHASCGCGLKRLTHTGEKTKLRWAEQECPAIDERTGKPFWGKIEVNKPKNTVWLKIKNLFGW